MNNQYIAFEGIDGCGKTTIIKKVESYLKHKFYSKVHTVKEPAFPGSTDFRGELRNLIFNNSDLSPRTELLLFAADRAELIDKEVVPALNKGYWVLSDRSLWSTLVYQKNNSSYSVWSSIYLSTFKEESFRLPKTFFLDISLESARRRILMREDTDRFEDIDSTVIQNRIDKYKYMSNQFPDDLITINVENKKVDDIRDEIISYLT